jgi:acyl transferase domain-containing protein
VFSAYDESGVARLTKAYQVYLASKGPAIEDERVFLDDLVYTLARKRTIFPWRVSIQADSISTLTQALSDHVKPLRASQKPGLAFIFTGQGAQWVGMGRDLIHYPVFKESLEHATDYLHELGCSWSLLGICPTRSSRGFAYNLL